MVHFIYSVRPSGRVGTDHCSTGLCRTEKFRIQGAIGCWVAILVYMLPCQSVVVWCIGQRIWETASHFALEANNLMCLGYNFR